MINVDLSKVVHPRFWNLLPAFMPGFFLEICILGARPDDVYRIVDRAHLDRYSLIVVALILAFILGNAFMFWVNLIQEILGIIYRFGRSGWRTFVLYLMRAKGSPPRAPRLASWGSVNQVFRRLMGSENDLLSVRRAWQKAAIELLRRRYGLEPPSWQHRSEWGPGTRYWAFRDKVLSKACFWGWLHTLPAGAESRRFTSLQP